MGIVEEVLIIQMRAKLNNLLKLRKLFHSMNYTQEMK